MIRVNWSMLFVGSLCALLVLATFDALAVDNVKTFDPTSQPTYPATCTLLNAVTGQPAVGPAKIDFYTCANCATPDDGVPPDINNYTLVGTSGVCAYDIPLAGFTGTDTVIITGMADNSASVVGPFGKDRLFLVPPVPLLYPGAWE